MFPFPAKYKGIHQVVDKYCLPSNLVPLKTLNLDIYRYGLVAAINRWLRDKFNFTNGQSMMLEIYQCISYLSPRKKLLTKCLSTARKPESACEDDPARIITSGPLTFIHNLQ